MRDITHCQMTDCDKPIKPVSPYRLLSGQIEYCEACLIGIQARKEELQEIVSQRASRERLGPVKRKQRSRNGDSSENKYRKEVHRFVDYRGRRM